MSEQTTQASENQNPEFPQRLLEFMRTGWRDAPAPPSIALDRAPRHAGRREKLSELFPGETLVIPTGREKVRNDDVHYPFRPGTAFVWLTGEHDPDGVLVLRPDGELHHATLYARPASGRDTDEFFRNVQYGELWVGRRASLAEKAASLGIETTDLADLDKALDGLDSGQTRVLRGMDGAVDTAVPASDEGERDAGLATELAELRLVKDDWEIAQLQDAIGATVRGFEDVVRALPADRGVSERLLDGVFALRARHDGSRGGYDSIVAAGPNATVLHWARNDGVTQPGELLLMDMGVENVHLYTADITRTLPVSGRFTPVQREVYDIVYAAQRAGIAAIRPGLVYREISEACLRVLTEGLATLGVLPCSVEEALDPESRIYRRWTLHGSGHMLGLDVHDCSRARKEHYREGPLAAGNVLTVEPGLYFQLDDELAPEELRGLGVRIEDDVLVTATGSRVLSAALPGQADEVERWMADQRAQGSRMPDLRR